MTDEMNGQGRFLRIENKLDVVVDTIGRVENRLTAIETAAQISKDLAETRNESSNLFWVKAGVYAALLMGTGSVITLWLIHIN